MTTTKRTIANKSKTYLFPLLADYLDLNLDFYSSISNTYVFDKDWKYDYHIFVEVDYSFKTPEFLEFEHSLTQNPCFVDSYDITDDKVIFVYEFPHDYLDIYNLYLEGKYSQYPKNVVEIIYNFYRKVYKNDSAVVPFLLSLKQIFSKDEKLKEKLEKELKVKISPDAELTSIFNKEQETIKLTE